MTKEERDKIIDNIHTSCKWNDKNKCTNENCFYEECAPYIKEYNIPNFCLWWEGE